MRFATVMFALAAGIAAAAAATSLPRIGDRFRVSTDREMEEHGNRVESGRSTSTDRDSYVERVVAVRPDGVVFEYDLPPSASAHDRAATWQFPFQVLKSPGKNPQLLNAQELDGRVDRWLKAAGATRASCGKLIFTWNAFRIDCDPLSAIRWLTTATLPDNLKVGGELTDPDARAPGVLRAGGANRLVATLQADPATIRRQRAKTDSGVAELMRKPLTMEAALKAHETEAITGTIAVTFDLDSMGRTRRRVRVRTIQIAWPNGRIDTQTVTETVTRTPL